MHCCGTNALIKGCKESHNRDFFGIPLMLCLCCFFLGGGVNFNFKIFRKFIQRNFLIKYIESGVGLVFLAVSFP